MPTECRYPAGNFALSTVLFAIFAHHPLWMKLLLIVRNKLVAVVGHKDPRRPPC
jgi:hypothetical protein